MKHERLFIDGQWCDGEVGQLTLNDRYRGTPAATIEQASNRQVDAAVEAARKAFRGTPIPAYQRYAILDRTARLMEERREAILHDLIAETGFALGDARNEIDRCVLTLQQCAEEAKRIHGECVPMEGAPGHEHRIGFTLRVPRGIVCAITPFNAPLNTVAHKIAPALAAGNAVVLKPAELTPICANHLARLLSDAGLPAGYFNVVHGPGETVGERLLANPSIDFYGFTGSTTVGERIRACIGLRHTSLELGNISSTIVCRDANLEMALPRIIASAFRKSGQVCTSIQKLFVQRSIYPELLAELKERLAPLKAGDPMDPDTFIGPLIDLDAATRVDEWIQEAVRGGAAIITGGERQGPVLTPTVLIDVPTDCRLFREEVFGPVICVIPFDSLDEAIDGANDSPYGLTAGIFTGNLDEGLSAARRIRVGSLHINETSSSRVDQMPSGGVKASGTGREGPRYAIEEMTEERLITISPSRHPIS